MLRMPVSVTGLFVAGLCVSGCSDATLSDRCLEEGNTTFVQTRNPVSRQPQSWPAQTECIGYWVDHRVAQGLATEIRHAFETWHDPCHDLCFRALGSTHEVTLLPEASFYPEGPNHNMIVFESSLTEWNERFGRGVLAVTLVTSRSDGAIVDADIVMNMAEFQFRTNGDCESDTEVDFVNALTHEVGHFLGFGHTTATDSTMYVFVDKTPGACETIKQTLTETDRDALCTIYSGNCSEQDGS